MGRPVYPHELKDPDFTWLLSNYTDKNPGCIVVDRSLLPVVLIDGVDKDKVAEVPALSPGLMPATIEPSERE